MDKFVMQMFRVLDDAGNAVSSDIPLETPLKVGSRLNLRSVIDGKPVSSRYMVKSTEPTEKANCLGVHLEPM